MQIGNGLKTIVSRVLKTDLDKLEEEDLQGISDVENAFRDAGVEVRKSATEFKSFDQIIAELAEKWDDLDQTTKQGVAFAAGATRQMNVFFQLMETMPRQMELYEEAMNSTGATLQANEKYTDSWKGKLDAFKASWQGFASEAVESEGLKSLVDLATSLLSALEPFASFLGVLTAASIPLFINGLILVALKSVNTNKSLWQLIKNFTGFDAVLKKNTSTLTQNSIAMDKTTNSINGMAISSRNSKQVVVGVGTASTTAASGISKLRFALTATSLAFSAFLAAYPLIEPALKKAFNGFEEGIENLKDLSSNLKQVQSEVEKTQGTLKDLDKMSNMFGSVQAGEASIANLEEFNSLLTKVKSTLPELENSWESLEKITQSSINSTIERMKIKLELQKESAKLATQESIEELKKIQKDLSPKIIEYKANFDTKEALEKNQKLNKTSLEAVEELYEKRAISEKAYKKRKKDLSDEATKIETDLANINKKISEGKVEILEYSDLLSDANINVDFLKELGVDTTDFEKALSKLPTAEDMLKDWNYSSFLDNYQIEKIRLQAEIEISKTSGLTDVTKALEDELALLEDKKKKQEEIIKLDQRIKDNQTAIDSYKSYNDTGQFDSEITRLSELITKDTKDLLNLQQEVQREYLYLTGEKLWDLDESKRNIQQDAEELLDIVKNVTKEKVDFNISIGKKGFQDAYEEALKINNSLSDILGAQEELSKQGSLSAETWNKLADIYPDILQNENSRVGLQEYLNILFGTESSHKDELLAKAQEYYEYELMASDAFYQQRYLNNEAWAQYLADVSNNLTTLTGQNTNLEVGMYNNVGNAAVNVGSIIENAMRNATITTAEQALAITKLLELAGLLNGTGIIKEFSPVKPISLPRPVSNYKPPTSNKNSSSQKDKVVEDLKLEIDVYYQYEKAIRDLDYAMKKLDARMEGASGKERIAMLKEQLTITEKLKKANEDLLKKAESEGERLRKQVEANGFKVNIDGTILNYEARFKELIIAPLQDKK